ncbi:Dcp-1 [Anthophora quadrimaculata]
MAIPSDASCISNANKVDEGAKEEILECPTAKDASAYNMNLLRRGKCVIFNHEYFDKGNGEQRRGTQFDVDAIEKTFGALGFEIIIYKDLLWYEVNEEIGKLAKENYKDYACICIFILTHGSSGGKLSARDASYPFVSIWTAFTADKCSTLFGKPKIFFTQACRGHHYDNSIRGRSETDYDEQSYTLPSQADFLFGYSSTEGSYSLREQKKGTWYIQTLCDMINEHWKNYDLVKILTITARKVGIEKSVKVQSLKEKKQMPVITTTLTRDIYFAPPPQ